MSYRLIRPETPVDAYRAPVIQIECSRCQRNAPDLEMQRLTKRFGRNLTIGALTIQVAGSGRKPCGLAGTGQCSAQAFEPPVWHWADLEQAWRGGWLARLHCQRHTAALKRTDPCPEVVILDVETLLVAYGYDFKLEKLPTKLTCPRCHTRVVSIEWVVPKPAPDPYAPAAADVIPLRLKPTRAQAGKKRLRVINGGE